MERMALLAGDAKFARTIERKDSVRAAERQEPGGLVEARGRQQSAAASPHSAAQRRSLKHIY